MILQDNFARKFTYLRLSVTDVCNFKCSYCLPDGYEKPSSVCDPLNLNEIKTIARAFANLGTKKIRITGGEPSVRKDLTDIIRICSETKGIETVALTTNGYKLDKYIEQWVGAGLTNLNVSIDSLDPKMFKQICGQNRLTEIFAGLDKAAKLGLNKIKVNVVLMKQYNQNEFNQYLEWIKDKPISLRFIELMQTGDNKQFFMDNHISGETLKQQLLDSGWTRVISESHAGPAQEFSHTDSLGKVGLIMPYSKDFCATCNRLRISSQGKLHLCLFGEEGLPIRQWCQQEESEALEQKIVEYLKLKKVSHFLQDGNSGSTRHLAMIGG